MSSRYTGVVGKSLTGNTSVAAEWQSYALVLVQQLIDRIKAPPFYGVGQQRVRKRLSDGTFVSAYVNMLGRHPIIRTWIESPYGHNKNDKEEETLPIVFLCVVWQPEGLLVTPRSTTAVYGYGFPKRDFLTGDLIDPPWGTTIESEADECRNQCLFNLHANNKYLDRPEYVTGFENIISDLPQNVKLRARIQDPVQIDGLAFYRHWPLGYEPRTAPDFDNLFWEDNDYEYVDDPGLNTQPSLDKPFVPFLTTGQDPAREPALRQFVDSETYVMIREEPVAQWFCHWPEECLYENYAFESCFQESNRLRVAVGEQPFIRPIRGIPNGAAMTVVEMQRAKVMFHDNVSLYRPGYGTLNSRIMASGLLANKPTGENVLIAPVEGLNSVDVGLQITGYWENSPAHYDNLVDSDWSSPKNSTSLHVGGGLPLEITESGPPSANVFNPPLGGYGYAQWMQGCNAKDQWLWGGLIVNETAFGVVSVRSSESWLSIRSEPMYSAILFFGGRFFAVGQALTSTTLQILGATAFIGSDDRMWFRTIFIDWGSSPSLKCFIAPLSSTDNSFTWLEESSASFSTLFNSEAAYNVTGASFTYDGLRGVLSVCAVVDDFATQWFPEDPQNPRARRNAMGLYTVQYSQANGFTTARVVAPKLVFNNVTDFDPTSGTYQCYEYSQTCVDSFSAYPYFDENDDLAWLHYEVKFISNQYKDDPALFVSNDKLTLPSGRNIVLTDYELTGGVPTRPCFNTIILYMDAKNDDVVYAKVPVRRAGSIIYASLEVWYNDVLLKTYAEQEIGNHYWATDPKLVSDWDDLSDHNLLMNVVDPHMFRNRDATGALHPFPFINTPWRGFAYCSNNPSVTYDFNSPCTGEHSISIGPRYGVGTFCFSSSSPDTFVWGYDAGVPCVMPYMQGLIHESEDAALCEFARYGDRVVLDIFFKQLHGVQLLDSNGVVNTEGEHIIWSNYDIENEIGIGQLTKITPLGVL